MQRRRAQKWVERLLSSETPNAEDIENALDDFGFYHEFSEVARMYIEHQNHGTLGYAGGVMDQPPEYWQDLDTMRWLEMWVKHVKPMPKLEQVSVFDTLRENGQFNGSLVK